MMKEFLEKVWKNLKTDWKGENFTDNEAFIFIWFGAAFFSSCLGEWFEIFKGFGIFFAFVIINFFWYYGFLYKNKK